MIDKHTLQTLEYSKVIDTVEGNCLTPYGRVYVSAIAPLDDNDLIKKRLSEVSQMKDIINFGLSFPLYRIEEDIREVLKQSTVEGNRLDPSEIRQVLDLVNDSIRLHSYDQEEHEKFPVIAEYLDRLRAFPELRDEINKAIDKDGSVRDNASPALRKIRIELNETRRKIMAKLENILSNQSKQAGWQDDVVTQRNDRYVIPVPASRYESGSGILHDRSQSGNTFYVEPQITVEMNNRVNLLMQEERLELDRILRALTAEIGIRSEALLENTRIIGQLDRIHASALFSNKIGGNAPTIIDECEVSILEARHPLLVLQLGSLEKVVPTDFEIGKDRQVILITGPNTGGKTITLKTIGLSVLMARSGLHISSDEKSVVGVFNQIHADIGDEQSIELSLSTFSSHITNIIRSLEDAAPDTLLLFDEIGAGTDPREGSALAESIILYGIDRGAKMVATTHYSQLKTMAMEHPEIENASLEFNRETLAPTYRLQLGIPGSSYAVEIASRLGMPKSICDRAGQALGDQEKSLTELIASLQEDLGRIKEDRKELSKRLAKANAQEQFYRMEMERLREDVDTRKKKSLEETETFLTETRREVERLVADIKKSNAGKSAVQAFHQNLKKRQESLQKRTQPKAKRPVENASFAVGDMVRVLSLDKQGEIEQLIGSDRAKVKIGNIATTVELRNLSHVDMPTSQAPLAKATSAHVPQDDDISPEIHLRGMTVEEATSSLDQYLDRAVLAGLTQVYVVHGKGTGALRRALAEYLRNHRDVANIRLGDWNEGGAGVTIVKLRE